jgi:hypothetical protein
VILRFFWHFSFLFLSFCVLSSRCREPKAKDHAAEKETEKKQTTNNRRREKGGRGKGARCPACKSPPRLGEPARRATGPALCHHVVAATQRSWRQSVSGGGRKGGRNCNREARKRAWCESLFVRAFIMQTIRATATRRRSCPVGPCRSRRPTSRAHG